MTNRHAERDHRTRRGHRLTAVAAAAIIGGVLMLWAWNTLAVDLFALPEARFRHVLALEAGLFGLIWFATSAAGIMRPGLPHHG